MRWITQFIGRIRARLSRWWSPPYRTVTVQDVLPASLQKRILYLVEDDGYQEQAAMICPCGCGNILQMNLLPDERPCWKVTKHEDGTATLHPSVWRKKDCRSHFWFHRGRIQWCRGGGGNGQQNAARS
ncbi:DUF6527 family protein [Mesorhizobium sp.]|uniref:DUF6527 family protein n=1 Tax=Mesorhizobium sp. TaxID=1871066 RepID=UPI000FE6C366|nr:DUF6527 family protein [Mesorhizobium sp.]RWK53166.1 MAG: hypothetical protein EOR48_22670 [Mesorhizobium sp.]TIP43519.1 MAG: hypothetical protein E5X62_18330 [Mesorhizobium sp.]